MRFLPAILIALLLPVSSSVADEISPPFGFRWNDLASRVEKVLKGAKAKIVGREKNDGQDVWTVEGLIHPGLKRTLFTFKGGVLSRWNCNTNIRIGRWNITTIGWGKSAATSMPSLEPGRLDLALAR